MFRLVEGAELSTSHISWAVGAVIFLCLLCLYLHVPALLINEKIPFFLILYFLTFPLVFFWAIVNPPWLLLKQLTSMKSQIQEHNFVLNHLSSHILGADMVIRFPSLFTVKAAVSPFYDCSLLPHHTGKQIFNKLIIH